MSSEQQQSLRANAFADLASINVNEYVEKKNGLSYLSWAWAVDQLLRRDPHASWEYRSDQDGRPYVMIGETAMVFCTVNAFGVSRTAQLPVMDYKNRAIPNPNSFEVNTAMQRCLAKAIALHGLGLYIYAGEDLPEGEKNEGAVQEERVAKTSPPASKRLVGEEEIKTINNLASAAGVDIAAICKAYKIDGIEELPLSATAAVVAKLQDKAKEKTKEQNNG